MQKWSRHSFCEAFFPRDNLSRWQFALIQNLEKRKRGKCKLQHKNTSNSILCSTFNA